MKNPIGEERHELTLECGCHAESLKFEFYDMFEHDKKNEEWNELYISHIIPSFYAMQHGTWDRIKNALAIIWDILRGREYRFFEVTLTDARQVIQLKKFLSEIDESTMLYNGTD